MRPRCDAAVRPDTRLIWVETPTNPLLKLVDLAAVAKLARSRGILTVCDNTFATPYIQRPLEHGFDVVMHSTTKYLNGHSDAIGGAAIVRGGSDLGERIAYLQNAVGGVPGPFDSFLTLRGIKTLALRMERHCSNALAIARFSRSTRRSNACTTPGSRATRSMRSRSGRWPAATAASSPRYCAAAWRRRAARSSAATCFPSPRAWGAWRA